ncbi:hypothetical protein BSPWISOX_2658 [uncultured Gammaproteobacteria bacterium]|nr:hypothetical protein BSPWISOX_2658 [uncultured Gammaproteobacteria bacterium]
MENLLFYGLYKLYWVNAGGALSGIINQLKSCTMKFEFRFIY